MSKTLNEIELNKFLEYNVNKVIEYYNYLKEGKHGIKKDSKRYLAKLPVALTSSFEGVTSPDG